MMRFLRPRTLIPALGLLAGLLGAAAPAQAQIIATVTSEADAEGNLIAFNIHLDNDGAATAADADEIRFFTTDGTATAGGSAATGGDDYEAVDTGFTLDIPALGADDGDAVVGGADETDITVQVTTNVDNVFEPDETINGFIQNAGGGLDVTAGDFDAVGTILNNDLRPTISIADSGAVSESDTTRDFVVTLSNPTFETVTVNYVTQDGTAVSGGPNPDYVAEGGVVTFAPFDVSETITIAVIDDTINEPDETFFVNLFDASLGTVNTGPAPGDPDGITDAQGLATIVDNDPDPTFSVFPSTQDVCETDPPINFTLTLSAPSQVPAVFEIDLGGSATFNTDYELRVNGVLYGAGDDITFAPGETVKTITLIPLDDAIEDPSEDFSLTFDRLSGIGGSDVTATGIILDDESLSVTIEQIPNSDGILDTDPEIDINGVPEICFRVTVTNECGDEVAGEEVEIVIDGNTGSDQVIFLTTDGEGEAEFCYTPLFPGGDEIDVFIDGVFFTDIFVDVDLAPGTDSRIEGSGFVDAGSDDGGVIIDGMGGGIGGGIGVPAYFSLNASRKRNGKLQGSVNVEAPFGGLAGKFRSTRITAMIAGDASPSGGHAAILFGTGKLTVQVGRNKFTDVVSFRVDVLDNGTPGVPNDRFVLTLLEPSVLKAGGNGGVFDEVIVVGGALKHARGKGVKNDVIIDTPGLPIGGGGGRVR